ncbi:MAG: hypothetical protein RBT11_20465 [Desulfobacterales bacterium]|jgi:hypothetical protein|nr:hypothetical protein [Desulfobacterales bacterium]
MDENTTSEIISLETVAQRFEQWRSSRSSKRERIPLELWHAAAALCHSYSINKVCRRLGLSNTDLKLRVSPEKTSTGFVQLDSGCFSGQWHLTCDRPDGASLRLSGNGMMPAVGELVREFFS